MRFINNLALFAIVPRITALVDLSKPYEKSDPLPTIIGQDLIDIANTEDDIHAFVAIECGKIVAEYGEQDTIRHLISITKSWTGLLMGIAEKENLLSLDETLGDIWPDEATWANIEDAEDRNKTTLEQLVKMRGGYEMPS